jgi:hypothetical protein
MHSDFPIFGKTLLNIKCVVIFSTTLVLNTSHSKKNSTITNLNRSSCEVTAIFFKF